MTTRQGSAKTIIFGISGQIKSVTLYCHTIFWRVEGLGEGCVNITLIVSCLEWITSLWRHWFSSRKRCRTSFPIHIISAPQNRLQDLCCQPTAIRQTHMGHTKQETRLNTFHLRSIHLGGQIEQDKVSDVQVLSHFDPLCKHTD